MTPLGAGAAWESFDSDRFGWCMRNFDKMNEVWRAVRRFVPADNPAAPPEPADNVIEISAAHPLMKNDGCRRHLPRALLYSLNRKAPAASGEGDQRPRRIRAARRPSLSPSDCPLFCPPWVARGPLASAQRHAEPSQAIAALGAAALISLSGGR
jgi:hypothetical protein